MLPRVTAIRLRANSSVCPWDLKAISACTRRSNQSVSVDVEVVLVLFEVDAREVSGGDVVRRLVGAVPYCGRLIPGLNARVGHFGVIVGRTALEAVMADKEWALGDHDVGAQLEDDVPEHVDDLRRARDAERLFGTQYANVLYAEERAGLPKLLFLGLRVRLRALVHHGPVALFGGLHELVVQLLVVGIHAVADRNDGDLVPARNVDTAGRSGVREVMGMGGDGEDSELVFTHG